MSRVILFVLFGFLVSGQAAADTNVLHNRQIIERAVQNCACKQRVLVDLKSQIRSSGGDPSYLGATACQHLNLLLAAKQSLQEALRQLDIEEQHLRDFENNYREETRGGHAGKPKTASELREALKAGREYKVRIRDKKYLDRADVAYDNAVAAMTTGVNYYLEWLDKPFTTNPAFTNRQRLGREYNGCPSVRP